LAPVSAPHRPGQAPWPEQRPAPIQFRPEPPPQRHENPVLIWTLRGLGLVAVAIISGVIWWYIHDDAKPAGAGSPPTTAQKTGQFEFTPAEQAKTPRKDPSCAEHSYGDIKNKFFPATPCEQLTRALYTTTAADGRTVYTNVSVVRMRNANDAAALREQTDKDGTGNVNDLVREKLVKLAGLGSLSGGGGYKAVQHDTNVIIIEADFDGAKRVDKAKDEALLDAICDDAVRLGDQIAG
jgi:hypothetical protein